MKKRDNYISWKEYFMIIAKISSLRSKDPSTQVGACIVKDNKILGTGYNGFPRDIPSDSLPWDKCGNPEDTKYMYVGHAEENAILHCAMNGVSAKGTILYTQWQPCARCTKSIIQSGIKEVIVHKKWDKEFTINHPYWKESCKRTICMFDEIGVHLRYYDGDILRIQGWKDGKVYTI
jgi:dCMP deaminase